MDFQHNNEILYNKHLMDYKDKSNREAVWDEFCEENNLDQDARHKWFQSQCTLFLKVTHMKYSQGELQVKERQKWTRDNFDFLRDQIVHQPTGNSKFRAPKGSASQNSAAARFQEQMQKTFTHVMRSLSQQHIKHSQQQLQHSWHSQQHFQQTFTMPHTPAQQ